MIKHWKTKEKQWLQGLSKCTASKKKQKNIDWNQSTYLNKFVFTDKKFDFS